MKIRGFRVELGAVDAAAQSHESVNQVVSVVRQGSENGESQLVTYAVLNSEWLERIEEARSGLYEHLKAQLPHYMVPSIIQVLEAMPLTPNGKINRKGLPEPTSLSMGISYQAPQGEVETRLCQLWSEVLKLDASTISRDANFFEVGGHSLLAIELVNKIKQNFSVSLPLTSIFRAPVLHQQALSCKGDTQIGLDSTSVKKQVNKPALLPLSYAQQRLWFIDQMEGRSSQYHMPATLSLQGEVNYQALQGAFSAVIAKHEVLRTTYHNDQKGHAYQHIEPVVQTFDLVMHDLSGLAKEEQGDKLDNLQHEFTEQEFDLSNDIMLRAALYKLAEYEYQLTVVMHHIASDGWSANVFIGELSNAYNQLVRGQQAELSPLDIQYSDYAIWQRQWLQGDNLTSQLNYWAKKLRDIPEVHSLPLDKPRPAKQCYAGDVVIERLEIQDLRSLLELCNANNASLFMGLNAVFSMLLSRYSGEQDIVVGTPIANREQSELAQTIGFFVNNLVLRSHVDMSQSFQQLLAQSRDTALAAYEHQNISFEHLVEELKPSRDLSHHPIFQVMLVLQNTPEDGFAFDGVQTSSVDKNASTTSFDLTLNIEQQANGLEMQWEFNTSLFEKATISRMAKHLVGLLRGVTLSPDEKMSEIHGLTDAEIGTLLALGNEPLSSQHNEVKGLCIHELFESQASASPNSIALIFEDRQVTYHELNRRSNQLAHHLVELGVGPDQLVGISCERSIELIEVMLAVLKAGGAYLPLDPTYPEERLAYMVQDSRLSLIVGDKGVQNKLPQDAHFIELTQLTKDAEGESVDNLSAYHLGVSSSSLAYVIYTSGSTGKPKGVMLQHDGLVDLAITQQQRFGISSSSRLLQFASFSFDGAVAEWAGVLNVGGTLVLINQHQVHSSEALTDMVHQHQVNYAILPPALLSALDVNKWHGVQHLILAGDSCPLPLANTWAQGRHLMNGYGPSETTVCGTIGDIKENTVSIDIGTGIPGKRLYVLDTERNLVPIGVGGELYIGGTGTARGYLHKPDLTDERFIQNPFVEGELMYRTGDKVRWNNQGKLEFLGRVDHQVKLRGFRVELGEVTSVILQQPQVNEAFVLVREDQGDKRLVAYWSANAGETIESNELREAIKDLLPGYMLPSAIVKMDKLPINANGKVERRQLPEPDYSLLSCAFEAARSDIELVLCEVWKQVLVIDQVGISDNFFSLGGDSILAMQVVSQAKLVGYKISTRDLFEYQTVKELAQVAQLIDTNQRSQKIIGSQKLLPIDHYFFAGDETDRHHFNQSQWCTLSESIDLESLGAVFASLYQRHDVMRLSFTQNNALWNADYLAIDERSADNAFAQSLWIEDLTVLDESQWAEHMLEVSNRAQASLVIDQTKGSMVRWVWCKTPSGQSDKLLWIMHHLIVDGVSWRILVQDLQLALEQVTQGAPFLLGTKSDSYQAWASAMSEFASSEAVNREKAHWLSVLNAPCGSLACGDLKELDASMSGNRRRVTLKFSELETKALISKSNECYHTQINDLLLAALADSYGLISGQNTLKVDLEGHGRESGVIVDACPTMDELDLSQTVGWFTHVYPVLLTNAAGSDLAILIKGIKEQLRATPNKGLGFGALRYLAKDDDIVQADRPSEIVFNYLGQFNTDCEEVETFKQLGDEVSKRRQRTHGIEITGIIVDGLLEFTFDYDAETYPQVSAIAEQYQVSLINIIEHCTSNKGGHTPSDFPLVDVTADDITLFESQYSEITDIYPSTPMQQGLLMHSQMAEGTGMYMCQMDMLFEELIIPTFKLAWQRVIERHDIFRTAFVESSSGELVQVVDKQAHIEWQELDWRSIAKEQQEARFIDLSNEERVKPLDLTCAPLMRFAMVTLSDKRQRFIWTNHHALLDGWCLTIVFDEVMKLYQAELGVDLGPLPVVKPYSSYVKWLQKQPKSEAKAYWQSYLSDVTEPCKLDFKAKLGNSEESDGSIDKLLDEQTTARLNHFAKHNQVTINTVVQGAWALLLHRYSGEETIVFGSTRSGRNIPLSGVETMVGLFINTLPVRVNFADMQCHLGQWLQELNKEQSGHDSFAYSPLSDIQEWSGIPSGESLFDSLVVVENYPISQSEQVMNDKLPRLIESNGEEQTNFPVTLVVVPDHQTEIKWLYQGSSISSQRMEKVAADFEHLLTMMLDSSDQALDSLTLLSKEEKHLTLVEWNQTDSDYDRNFDMAQWFESCVARTPDGLALVHGDHNVTYQDLNARANRLAHYLSSQGIEAQQRIGVCLPSGVELITALLAIVKLNAVYVPIDSSYPAERQAHILQDTQAGCVLTKNSMAIAVSESMCVRINIDSESLRSTLDKASSTNPERIKVNTKDSPAYVMYTSGSTGMPKGVEVTQQGVIRLVKNNSALPLTQDTVMLQCASVTFDAATLEIWGPLLNGGTLVVYPETLVDATQLGKVIDHYQVNMLWLTSGLFDQFVAINEHNLPSLKHLLTGGDVVNPYSVSRFYQQQADVTVINGYGPTENTTFTTCYPIPRELAVTQPIPIGKPISNTTVYVLDRNQKPVPVGAIGELYTGGEGVAKGYINQTALTAERFIPNPFAINEEEAGCLYRTGDLVRWQQDGTLMFVGRADSQVKVRGYRIELGEIESQLMSIDEVDTALVVVKERQIEQSRDKQLLAYVVGHAEMDASSEHIRAALSQNLPSFMLPDHIVLMDQFPLNANGKVDRRALPEPKMLADSDFVASQTDTEHRVSELWCELLNSSTAISAVSSFLEVGGNSLLLMRMNALIKDRFGVELTIEALFASPTIQGIASMIEQHKDLEESTMLDDILKQVEDLDIEDLESLDIDDLESLID
ncbi:amino acid adenylation domain-containing protein [Vibrio sp. Of14-4]|nr:amino acid adenylation domain-containing protein [Vibrio sp. Of14-4]